MALLPSLSWNMEPSVFKLHGWPDEAILRFFHILSDFEIHTFRTNNSRLFLLFLREKMKFVSSDEKFVSPVYIHPEDVEKFKKSQETFGARNRTIEYFRTNLNVNLDIKRVSFPFQIIETKETKFWTFSSKDLSLFITLMHWTNVILYCLFFLNVSEYPNKDSMNIQCFLSCHSCFYEHATEVFMETRRSKGSRYIGYYCFVRGAIDFFRNRSTVLIVLVLNTKH